jgi:hypothetical protein
MKRLRINRETGITIALGLAALLVVALGFLLAVKPQQDASADLSDEIAALEVEFQTEQVRAAAAEDQDGDASGEDQESLAQVFELSKAVPAEIDEPGVLLELNALADASGATFTAIAPGDGIDHTGYSARAFNATFTGTYPQLSNLLRRARTLVMVRGGELRSRGHLYLLTTFDLHQGTMELPEIEATLTFEVPTFGSTDGGSGTEVSEDTTDDASADDESTDDESTDDETPAGNGDAPTGDQAPEGASTSEDG